MKSNLALYDIGGFLEHAIIGVGRGGKFYRVAFGEAGLRRGGDGGGVTCT